MSIVTISKGAYSQGKEVAEIVARKLGFQCISRRVFGEASQKFNVPELQLLRAFRDAPSIVDRFTFGKEKYVTYIQTALLDHFQRDNVVYHGLAGHYFVQPVSHVLKVRIIGMDDDRADVMMQREELFEQAATAFAGMSEPAFTPFGKQRTTSKEEALRSLRDVDEARRKWGLYLYGIDTQDPSLYDLVIRTKKLSIEDAADMICMATALKRFQATARSQQAMDDLALAARVKAALIEDHPRINVVADKGAVYVALEGGSAGEQETIRRAVEKIPQVKEIDVNLYPFVTPD